MISNKDRSRLNLAAKAASNSVHKHRVGAVLVSGGSVVAQGYNRVRMVDRQPYEMCTEHAEECALRMRGYNADGDVMYVARLGAGGAHRLAKPCSRCLEQLASVGIKRVVYTTDNGGDFIRL